MALNSRRHLRPGAPWRCPNPQRSRLWVWAPPDCWRGGGAAANFVDTLSNLEPRMYMRGFFFMYMLGFFFAPRHLSSATMSFHFGKPILVMIAVARISGIVIVARSAQRK